MGYIHEYFFGLLLQELVAQSPRIVWVIWGIVDLVPFNHGTLLESSVINDTAKARRMALVHGTVLYNDEFH